MTGTGQLAVLLAGAGGLLLAGRGSAAAARLRVVRARPGGSGGRSGGAAAAGSLELRAPPVWLTRVLGAGAGCSVLTGRGALATVLVVAALATWLPGQRASAAQRRAEQAAAHDLPRVADLLAACLEAGLSVGDAAAVVGAAVPGRLGAQLGLAGGALLAGADLSSVWSEASPSTGAWPRLAGALEQGSTSGAPLAGLLRSLADDERDRAHWEADAAAQRAGVRAIGPLVACFLPAFVLVGVVPVVVGIAGRVVGDLG